MNIAVIFFIFFVWIAIVVGICALFVWICKKIAESKISSAEEEAKKLVEMAEKQLAGK